MALHGPSFSAGGTHGFTQPLIEQQTEVGARLNDVFELEERSNSMV